MSCKLKHYFLIELWNTFPRVRDVYSGENTRAHAMRQQGLRFDYKTSRESLESLLNDDAPARLDFHFRTPKSDIRKYFGQYNQCVDEIKGFSTDIEQASECVQPTRPRVGTSNTHRREQRDVSQR